MRHVVYFFAVLVTTIFWIYPVQAAQVQPLQGTTSTSLVLHIDEGFLGRPAVFNLFDGAIKLTWSAGGVIQPLDITFERSSATSVKVFFSNPLALGSPGISISLKPIESAASTWDEIVLEVATSTAAWQVRSSSQTADGYLSARLDQSAELRVSVRPRGMRQGQASWYRYKRCRCAASPDFPKGTQLYVRRIDQPDRATVVIVNDFGPERDIFPERVIDLDALAFAELSPLGAGIIWVTVEPLISTDPRSSIFYRPTDKILKIAYPTHARQVRNTRVTRASKASSSSSPLRRQPK